MSQDFGIEFVAAEDLPDAPRTNTRNDALWVAVKEVLKGNPGEFARVKVYPSATSAGQKANGINNGRDKKFPVAEWAARYEADRTADSSTLYLAFRNPDGSVNV